MIACSPSCSTRYMPLEIRVTVTPLPAPACEVRPRIVGDARSLLCGRDWRLPSLRRRVAYECRHRAAIRAQRVAFAVEEARVDVAGAKARMLEHANQERNVRADAQ